MQIERTHFREELARTPPNNHPLAKLLEEPQQEDERVQTAARLRWLATQLPENEGVKGVRLLAEQFDTPLVQEFIQFLSFDPSLATLFGVHFFLFGVSIYKLGEKRHHDAYLDKVDSMGILGCCLMTEIGHGSNVLNLETEARYDNEKRGFFIRTPNPAARKCWIGGAAKNATHGVLFARLKIEGKDYGIHPFIVEMRQDRVETMDLGPKRGLNGVDNGYVAFQDLFIPYENALTHYWDITETGEYVGKNGNKNPQNLVFKLMIQFVYGRKIIALSSAKGMEMLSTLTAVYPPPASSRPLVDMISSTYALKFALPLMRGSNHVRASMLKAAGSDMTGKHLRWAREVYASSPDIRDVVAKFVKDQDVTTTYEGDNVLLWQLVAREALLKAEKWGKKLKEFPYSSVGSVLLYAMNADDPTYQLMKTALFLAAEIGEKMKGAKTQTEQFRVFSRQCQIDGIRLAKIYTEILIGLKYLARANEFYNQGRPEYKAMYRIYVWGRTRELAPELKRPDLRNDYELVEKKRFKLVREFGFQLNWLDAMIPPHEKILDKWAARL